MIRALEVAQGVALAIVVWVWAIIAIRTDVDGWLFALSCFASVGIGCQLTRLIYREYLR